MKNLAFFLFVFLPGVVTFAQTPQSFRYQAVVRDNTGNILVNQPVSFRISILSESESGTTVYRETQTSLTTNTFGLIEMDIGNGTPETGTFSTINWGDNSYYVKVEMDPAGETSYQVLSTSQLLSVPYALHARTAENVIMGDALDIVTRPNILIGPGAGKNTPPDSDNLAIGDSALYNNGLETYSEFQATGNTAVGSGALYSNTSGESNTALGFRTLNSNIEGSGNTAISYQSLFSNTLGSNNTAVGNWSLNSNTTGNSNAAMGSWALNNNTTGSFNTALGRMALSSNTTGKCNTANGNEALYNNSTGKYNSANGNQALYNNSTGNSNVAIGNAALYQNTTIDDLVAIGDSALYNNGIGASELFEATHNTAIGANALFSNTTGYSNTANGSWALRSNTSGYSNTANGNFALGYNTTGNNNTADGYGALCFNTSGSSNTAIGDQALYYNTSGANNCAIGFSALVFNTSGYSNVAIGVKALLNNRTQNNLVAVGDSALFWNGVGASQIYHGTGNTAIGSKTLYYNTTGYHNTAIGNWALSSNSSGHDNVASGYRAMSDNTEGFNNSAVGDYALGNNTTGIHNIAVGSRALQVNVTGNFNVAVGCSAGPASGNTNLSNTGAFGWFTEVNESNTIRLGNSSITSIGGYTGWSNLSDGRFKTHIQNNVPGLNFIMKLNPVTFSWDMDKLDAHTGVDDSVYIQCPEMRTAREEKVTKVYSGFIAQEVEEAANAVDYDFSAIIKPQNEKSRYQLSYAEFVVPLVKAMQEQQVQIQLLQKEVDVLKQQLAEK